MALKWKPHITRFGNDRWLCSGRGCYGLGYTPFSAYQYWRGIVERDGAR